MTRLNVEPRHAALATAYTAFVTSPLGQAVYARFGFVGASESERSSRAIE